MKIVIPGGSGRLGTILARGFVAQGHEVVVISRSLPATHPWRWLEWDGKTPGEWAGEIDNADVVINLAGRSVDCRYTARNMREIMESRVASTKVVGEAIARAARPPHTWLQASTATIYAHRFDAANDERNGLIGGGEQDVPRNWDFSIDVARAWESAMDAAAAPRTRKIKMRTAVVMNAGDGGAFDQYLRLVRVGLGGAHAGGKQFMSWIHARDFFRAVQWMIEHPFLDRVVNVTAPNPLPNAEFMRELRHAWGRRVGLPAAKAMLEIGAFVLRTDTELILKSRRVTPTRLLETGFRFEFPTWPEAARDLCERWRHRGERSISLQSQPVL